MSLGDSHGGDGSNIARRHADADLELAGLDEPVVRVGIPERERAAVEDADHRRALTGVERDLRERAQLLLGTGDGRVDVVHVALHDFGARAGPVLVTVTRNSTVPSASISVRSSSSAPRANDVYERPCPNANRGSMRRVSYQR